MPRRKKQVRYLLHYRVAYPEDPGGLRKWWTAEHTQEERHAVAGTTREDAWYSVILQHDNWEKHPPRIERLSIVRRTGSRPSPGRTRMTSAKSPSGSLR